MGLGVTVLDASAVLALLLGEPAAVEVEGLVRNGALLSAVNLVEVVYRAVRGRDLDRDEVAAAVSALKAVGLAVVPVDERVGVVAADVRIRHFHRSASPVSLADCVAVATARRLDVPLATSDAALVTVATLERVEVAPLPNSSGIRPTT